MSASVHIIEEQTWGAWAQPWVKVERGLFEKLTDLDATWLDSVSFTAAPRGGWGVKVEDFSLTSAYAAREQAATLVSVQNLENAQFVVVLGCGDGSIPIEVYHATAQGQARVLVLEPHPGVIRGALTHNQELRDCDPERLQLFSSIHKLKLHIYHSLQTQGALLCICPPVYTQLYPQTRDAVLAALAEAASMVDINRRTGLVRTRQWVHNLLANSAHGTHCPSLFSLQGLFQDRPAVVIAAGPSLDKNIHLLREVQDRVLIVCVNTSLKAVLAAGITPDLVMSLEGLDVSSHFEGVDTSALNLALSQTCSPRLYGLNPSHTFTFLDASPSHAAFSKHRFHHEEPILDVGGCIANAAFSATQLMGCNPVILMGQDLAYTQGQMYAKGTVFEDLHLEQDKAQGTIHDPKNAKQKILDASEMGEGGESFEAERRLFPVTSWDQAETVWTSLDFNLFRYWYQEQARALLEDQDLTLINATEGGAHIEGFQHLSFAQVVQEHLQHSPPQDDHALIRATHAKAPRLNSKTWRQGLTRALQSCTRLRKQTSQALASLGKAQGILAKRGHDDQAFAKAMNTFTREESKVARISRSNVLVNAYVRASLPHLAQDLEAQNDAAGDTTQQWTTNLTHSRAILRHIEEAAKALHVRIRDTMQSI